MIAIYLALGGIGVASHGAPDSIDSADIVDGQVRSADVGNRQVRSADVALDTGANALTGGNIAADTITDADLAASAQFNGAPAGGDLAGSYPDPTLAPGSVSGGNGGDIADGTITGDDVDESTLSGLPPAGAAGGDLAGNYPDPTIAAGAVGSAAVADDSLTAADLATGAVTTDEVASSTLTGADVANNTLTGTDVADTSSLTGAEILEQSLTVGGDLIGVATNAQIADNTINEAQIVDGAVGEPEIGGNAVGSNEVAADSLGAADLATGAVGADEIQTSGVGSAEVATNSLSGVDISDTSSLGSPEINEAGLSPVPEASTVDGIDSTNLVIGRSDTADTGQCTGSLPIAYETCADVSVNFPHAGRALVVATAGWEATARGNGELNRSLCAIQVDETNTISPEQNIGDHGGTTHESEFFQESVAMQAMTPVLPAGPHPFEFNCRDIDSAGVDDTDIDEAYISVLVVGSG